MQHITPNSKRWDYSDIPGGSHGQIKGPAHMVEGGHYPRNRPPTLGTTSGDFYHYPVMVWAYSTPQPNTEVPAPTGGTEKSPLVQVMAWCHQETSHCLRQYSTPSYCITRQHWIKQVLAFHEEGFQLPKPSLCRQNRKFKEIFMFLQNKSACKRVIFLTK